MGRFDREFPGCWTRPAPSSAGKKASQASAIGFDHELSVWDPFLGDRFTWLRTVRIYDPSAARSGHIVASAGEGRVVADLSHWAVLERLSAQEERCELPSLVLAT